MPLTPLGMPARLKRRRRLRPVAVLSALFLLLAAVTVWLFNRPSEERVAPFDGRAHAIVYQGNLFAQPFAQENGEILLPFDFVKACLDPFIYWDEPTQSVIVTTRDRVLRMESGKLTAFVNGSALSLRVPVQEAEGIRYLPLTPLEKLYPVRFRHVPSADVLVVESAGYAVQQGEVLPDHAPEQLRTGPSIKRPIVAEAAAGTVLDVLGEEAGWYRVQTQEGLIGYVPKDGVALTRVRQTPGVPSSGSDTGDPAWKPLGETIALVWEHVVTRNPDPTGLAPMPGVHVVSPTWFELIDDQGALANKADPAYVKWAHRQGYRVWGLVSNGFDPDKTHGLLSDFRKREGFVRQLLAYARLYDLDGINLDFENVYLEDKERLIQLVRELTPYLHEQGLTVSIDVTVKTGSERWSQVYDRKALAEIVDYVALMTYDEHWATSPVAGSVASLPWTERSLQDVLKEVPRQKLLLGVPFYTRLWKEEKQPDGSVKVTSKALSMSKAQAWLNENHVRPVLDAATGQWYAEVSVPAERAVYKMWLEDKESMKKRIDLVRKYRLAGVAAWRRGFETPEIWTVVEQGLKQPR